MKLMTCRYLHLVRTLAGYQKTGIPLLGHDGSTIQPFSAADDMGIYVLIPKLASWFCLEIPQAINLFFYGSALLAWLMSVSGFWFYYKSLLQRVIALIGVSLLMLFSLKVGDTYLFYVAPTVALAPWALYLFKRQWSYSSLLFYLLAGTLISLTHYIRSYASIGILFFATWLLITNNYAWKKKMLSFGILAIGLSLPGVYFNHLYQQYSDFLKKEQITNPADGIKNHLLWHSIYAGFGFLSFKNPDNIRWGDPYALQKAQSIKPGVQYNTLEYEEILKKEIIKLIKHYPAFVIMTIFAKIGILLLYLFVFANFGLIAAFFYPKLWEIESAFWGALVFNSIFSLLVIPTTEYSLGFIAFATLYGIVSINYYLYKTSN